MAAPAQGKRSWFWAQGLGCGVLVATAAPLAVVLGVLFAPALLAAIMVPPQVATRRLGGVLMVYGLAAADGVVVGSAIVKVIAEHGNGPELAEALRAFVEPLVRAAKE